MNETLKSYCLMNGISEQTLTRCSQTIEGKSLEELQEGVYFTDVPDNSSTMPIFLCNTFIDALTVAEIGASAVSCKEIKKLDEYLKMHPLKAPFYILAGNDRNEQILAPKRKHYINTNGCKAEIVNYSEASVNKLMREDKEHFNTFICSIVSNALNSEIECEKAFEQSDIGEFINDIFSRRYEPIPTNIPFLDELLDGGLYKQSLVVVMAEPGAGKSTLCQQIGESLARAQRKVIYINLEMSNQQMYAKAFTTRLYELTNGRTLYTSSSILRAFNLSQSDQEKIKAIASDYYSNIAPYINYIGTSRGAGLNNIKMYLDKIGSEAMSNGEDAPIVILDYLHLLQDDGKVRKDTGDFLKSAILEFKQYAIKYNSISIVISATNRASNGRALSFDDARDTSGIEYTADLMLGLYFKAYDDGGKRREATATRIRKVNIKICKNRFGAEGKERALNFDTYASKFYDADGLVDANANIRREISKTLN